MSTYESLFLSHFNPCPSRVEAIEQLLLDGCDDHTKLELLDHLEKCRRCKKYYIYLEAVDNGFKEYHIESFKNGPIAHSELPSSLKAEMAQAMKRNLAKWLFEAARSIMYRQGLTVRFLLDFRELHPVEKAVLKSNKLYNSINSLNSDTLTNPNELQSALSTLLKISNNTDPVNNLTYILNHCIALDNYFLYPYCFLDQLYIYKSEFKEAISTLLNAINTTASPIWKSHISNNLGNIFIRAGDIEKAISSYSKAINFNESPIAHLNLCYSLSLNNKGRANHHLRQAYFCLANNNISPSIKALNVRHAIFFINNNKNLFSNIFMNDNDIYSLIINIGKQYGHQLNQISIY